MRGTDTDTASRPVGLIARPTAWWRGGRGWVVRLVASPRFRRWAEGFWLTRPFARRQAAQLFDLVAGFVYTQVLLACVRLDLFERLATRGPQTAAVLAGWCALPPRSMQRLLDAAVAARLLSLRDGGEYGLGALGAPMVGNAPLAAMVEHHATLYADLGDPLALLRAEGAGSRMSAYWPYAGYPRPEDLPPGSVGEYSALMTASQPMIIDEVLDAYPLRGHQCLLDVGGGEGGFAAAAATSAPALQLMLFDLPRVAELARVRLAGLGLGDRVRVHGGSFFTDPLPMGADVVSLVRVLFDHDDAHAVAILRAARAALPVGGALIVAEPMSGGSGGPTRRDAYLGLYLLAMGKGQSRPAAALAELMREAGFDEIRVLPTRQPLQVGVLLARAAGARVRAEA